jgi:hypothetical protein
MLITIILGITKISYAVSSPWDMILTIATTTTIINLVPIVVVTCFPTHSSGSSEMVIT